MVLFNEFIYKSFLEINEAIILFYFGFHEDEIKKDTKGMDVHGLSSVKVSSLERVIPSPTQAQTSYNCHPQIPSKSLLTNQLVQHPPIISIFQTIFSSLSFSSNFTTISF